MARRFELRRGSIMDRHHAPLCLQLRLLVVERETTLRVCGILGRSRPLLEGRRGWRFEQDLAGRAVVAAVVAQRLQVRAQITLGRGGPLHSAHVLALQSLLLGGLLRGHAQ